MRTYTEYKVKLSDSQKSKLASAIRNNSSLTLNDQIPIPKKFFPMVAPFQRSLQKNRERKSTKLIKPVEWLSNQQENRLKEDYWEHLPLLELHWQLVLYQRCLVPVFNLIEHHLVTQQKYGCHQPQHVARVNIHMHHHHSLEVGKMQLEQELKKILKKGKRNSTRKKQPVQFHSNSRRNFGNKALSNFDLFD